VAIQRRKIRFGFCVGVFVLLSAAVTSFTAFARGSVPTVEQAADPAASACSSPANATVAENCLPGTEGWQNIEYSAAIDIFASDDSVNAGGTLDLFVDTESPSFDLKIYRIGYYGGIGARLIQEVPNLTGQQQPSCIHVEDVGLRSCSNWQVSYTLTIPADWVSGIYAAQTIVSGTNTANETVFAVRQDDRKSDMLYQMSTTTFQAYNNYDGKSVYNSNSGTCDTVANAPRAVKVSFNRPYNATPQDPNYFYRAEYPMVRWLEQQGYDITYSTNMDTHRSGLPGAHNALLDHKIFLPSGHDEYWSQPMRDAITAARDAGVNVGFFTSNTGYWRIRFEPDPVTNEPDSVMVTYKSTESGSPDPSGEPTGTWRDPQGANNPENALIGVMYIGDNDRMYFPLRLSSETISDPLFRHTGLQDMPPNSYIDVGNQVIGWEWDAVADNGVSPDGLTVLAKTPLYGFLLQDAGRSANGNMGSASAYTTRYTAPSGAIVFASGTIQWSWGLGAQGLEITPVDPYIQQITYNLFADMGVQPTTPVADLILDGSDTPDLALPTGQIKTEGEAAPPIISDVQSTADDTSFTVSWKTDLPTTGQLWWGTSPDHIINPAYLNTEHTTDHRYTATNLIAGRTYYFKFVTITEEWVHTVSDTGTITTSTGSIPQRVRAAVEPIARQGACWVRANRTGAVIMGVLGVAIVVLLVTPFVVMRRRRRMQPA